LEGNEAHGRIERRTAGNGGATDTDSSVEQGPEAGHSASAARRLCPIPTGSRRGVSGPWDGKPLRRRLGARSQARGEGRLWSLVVTVQALVWRSSRRPEPHASEGSVWSGLLRQVGAARRGNSKRATAAVTRCGYRRGAFFEGFEGRRGERQGAFGAASAGSRVPMARKRDEPQGRQRDATSPHLSQRRKPSRWCETTRAERDPSAGAARQRTAGSQGLKARSDVRRE